MTKCSPLRRGALGHNNMTGISIAKDGWRHRPSSASPIKGEGMVCTRPCISWLLPFQHFAQCHNSFIDGLNDKIRSFHRLYSYKDGWNTIKQERRNINKTIVTSFRYYTLILYKNQSHFKKFVRTAVSGSFYDCPTRQTPEESYTDFFDDR